MGRDMRAIVFRESRWWVGQCIERDIAVQAKTFTGVKKEFKRIFDVYKMLRYPLHRHPKPPAYAIRRPGRMIRI